MRLRGCHPEAFLSRGFASSTHFRGLLDIPTFNLAFEGAPCHSLPPVLTAADLADLACEPG